MIRLVFGFLMLATLGAGAGAETAGPAAVPRLKELVVVASELVRIGDLVENAGEAADVPVFRAPDLGETGTVPVARVTDALTSHGLDRLDTGGLGEVVVTRLSRSITVEELKDRIARAFAGQFGFGDAHNLSVALDRHVRTLHVEAAVTTELSVTRMNVDQRTGRFDVSFELPGSGVAQRLRLRFTGTVAETLPAATLVRSLRPGDVVKASDIAVERRPKHEVGTDTIAAEQAIGLAAKHPLRGGQVLRPADLAKPQIVQRNEAVTIIYEVPGVMLTVRGKALESGALGDIVSVMNVQSNRTIQGTVSAPGRITVAAATPIPAATVAVAGENSTRSRTQ